MTSVREGDALPNGLAHPIKMRHSLNFKAEMFLLFGRLGTFSSGSF